MVPTGTGRKLQEGSHLFANPDGCGYDDNLSHGFCGAACHLQFHRAYNFKLFHHLDNHTEQCRGIRNHYLGGHLVNTTTPTPTPTIQLGGAATNSAGTATGNQASTQANTYTAPQQAAQTALLNQLSGFTAGTSTAPTSLTNPTQLQTAANDAFNQWTAPGIAAQFGAGSPQIGQQQAMMDEQLAAQNYQAGVNQYLTGNNQLQNAAFNTMGQTSTGTSANSANNNNEGVSAAITGAPGTASVLSAILGLLGLTP